MMVFMIINDGFHDVEIMMLKSWFSWESARMACHQPVADQIWGVP